TLSRRARLCRRLACFLSFAGELSFHSLPLGIRQREVRERLGFSPIDLGECQSKLGVLDSIGRASERVNSSGGLFEFRPNGVQAFFQARETRVDRHEATDLSRRRTSFVADILRLLFQDTETLQQTG